MAPSPLGQTPELVDATQPKHPLVGPIYSPTKTCAAIASYQGQLAEPIVTETCGYKLGREWTKEIQSRIEEVERSNG